MGKLAGLGVSLGFAGIAVLIAGFGSTNQQAETAIAADVETAIATTQSPVVAKSLKIISPEREATGHTADALAIHPLMMECCRNLDRVIERLQTIDGYTARWVQQIQKYGSLRDEESVDIKIRHQPFSVHMNWCDGSQQVLYVDGLHDGKLLAHKSRGFASLRSLWKLPPDSRLAMKDSRYPVTDLGMLKLAERLKQIVCDLPLDATVDVHISQTEFQERPCIRQYVKFGSPADQPEYSQSDLLIDEQTLALVSITNHGWNDDDTAGEMLEHYRYENIHWNAPLSDSDFDAQNAAYPFAE